MNDLDNIINYLTRENTASCSDIQSRIKAINTEIIELEAMLDPAYRTKLSNELKYKQEQLSNAQSAKPKEVQKPSVEENPEAIEYKKEIEALQESTNHSAEQLQKLRENREIITKLIQDLLSSKEKLSRIISQISIVKEELRTIYEKVGLTVDDIFSVSFNSELLNKKIEELNTEFSSIEKQLNPDSSESLASKNDVLIKRLEEAKLKLSAPELEYQKYLKDKQEWEKMLEDIIGSSEKDGTIKNYQARLDYIDHQLSTDLTEKKEQRKQYVEELIQKKHEVLDTYNNLFAPIVKFIHDYHEELKDYPIEFDATFAIRNFGDKLFDYVSQQSAGSYYGKELGAARIKDNIDCIDMTEIASLVDFACLINDDLLIDKREGQGGSRLVEGQLKKGHTKQELYDFIYCMDYVIPFFQLKMNGKPLSSLSPGERGALLLLLYLFIDMDDKPLIIDQPEENLDNESVFKYLVHFIKAAKKKRQIIMVTHNPNLAVVCDADQIIQMKIDKFNGNKVSFESGAIENPKMNKIIVDILEGTYPAFHNRDCKYFDKTF